MKNNWLAILLALSLLFSVVSAVDCAPSASIVQEQSVVDISAEEAYELIQDNLNNPDFVILDVRTPEEFAEGHIEGAINMDYYEGGFRDELDTLDKNKTYLMHCRSGSRSGRTLDIMEELDFARIYHMNGGMIEWEAEELPVVK